MYKTVLLCFIHGFKGGDDTFGKFPEHLQALLQHTLPKVTVKAIIYPQFETRGDLKECVGRLREWLQDKVIDIEADAGTPSANIDPSVRTILIGHSMGGIVAADTLLSITSEAPISTTSTPSSSSRPSTPPLFNFPYIQGILALDTPYLGISPGVVAHGAESHYKTASSAYSAFTEAASVFGWGASQTSSSSTPKPPANRKAIAAGPSVAQDALKAGQAATTASKGNWGNWGKVAMFAGAVAAGGAAAYMKRDAITEGWGWVGSHLEFVGCLMRGEELKTRVARVRKLSLEHGIGFKDLYTVLGRAATGKDAQGPGGVLRIEDGAKRTFCALPRQEEFRGLFEGVVDEVATEETGAHMGMFERNRRGYRVLVEKAKGLVVEWVRADGVWYEGSEGVGGKDGGEVGKEVRQEL